MIGFFHLQHLNIRTLTDDMVRLSLMFPLLCILTNHVMLMVCCTNTFEIATNCMFWKWTLFIVLK